MQQLPTQQQQLLQLTPQQQQLLQLTPQQQQLLQLTPQQQQLLQLTSQPPQQQQQQQLLQVTPQQQIQQQQMQQLPLQQPQQLQQQQQPPQQQQKYQTAVHLANLQEAPSPVDCPVCGHRELTVVEKVSGNTTQYVQPLPYHLTSSLPNTYITPSYPLRKEYMPDRDPSKPKGENTD